MTEQLTLSTYGPATVLSAGNFGKGDRLQKEQYFLVYFPIRV